jgi:NADH:ubiquinone oxidoreductase subunit
MINEPFSWIARLSHIGTWFFTTLSGDLVGTDSEGNRYYRERKKAAGAPREKRWVMYNGRPEASRIPPEWHGWMHYTFDAPLPKDGTPAWGKPHQANLTFSDQAYLPPGHFMEGGKRKKATGDYQSWKPE